MEASCLKYRNSSIRYNFIAIIFPNNFVSRPSSFAFKEELPIGNTCEVVFGSTIEVAGKGRSSDGGIDLLLESLMAIKLFSSAGDILGCEWVDWGVFDVVLLASIGL